VCGECRLVISAFQHVWQLPVEGGRIEGGAPQNVHEGCCRAIATRGTYKAEGSAERNLRAHTQWHAFWLDRIRNVTIAGGIRPMCTIIAMYLRYVSGRNEIVEGIRLAAQDPDVLEKSTVGRRDNTGGCNASSLPACRDVRWEMGLAANGLQAQHS
jgi:hypothetical protein